MIENEKEGEIKKIEQEFLKMILFNNIEFLFEINFLIIVSVCSTNFFISCFFGECVF